MILMIFHAHRYLASETHGTFYSSLEQYLLRKGRKGADPTIRTRNTLKLR